jgi:hypothetical protein
VTFYLTALTGIFLLLENQGGGKRSMALPGFVDGLMKSRQMRLSHEVARLPYHSAVYCMESVPDSKTRTHFMDKCSESDYIKQLMAVVFRKAAFLRLPCLLYQE